MKIKDSHENPGKYENHKNHANHIKSYKIKEDMEIKNRCREMYDNHTEPMKLNGKSNKQ